MNRNHIIGIVIVASVFAVAFVSTRIPRAPAFGGGLVRGPSANAKETAEAAANSAVNPRDQQAARNATTIPEIGFTPGTIELGRIPWYSRMPFEAVFANDSAAAIKIMTVKPSCGCTGIDVMKYTNQALSPGDTIEMAGAIEVGNQVGDFTRTIELLLDTGTIHTLHIKYEAFSTYHLSSDRVVFGDVDLDSDEDVYKTIVFRSTTAKIVPDRWSVDAPWIDVSTQRIDDNSTEITLRIRKNKTPPGKRVVQVNVMTNDPYRMHFPVFAEFNGVSEVTAVPPRLFLQVGEQGRIHVVSLNGDNSRIIDLRCLDRDAIEIDIDASDEHFNVRVKSVPALETTAVTIVTDGGRTAFASVTVVKDK